MPPLTIARAAAVAALVLTASACTSSDDPTPTPAPSAASSATSDQTTSGQSISGQPGLVADDGTAAGTSSTLSGCSPKPGGATRQTRYEPTATAHSDLTVTGVEVVGTGVSVADAEGVLVTRPDDNGRALISPTWPVRGRDLPSWADASSRTDLDGMSLAAGDQLLPLVRLDINRASGQASMSALRLTYTADGATATVGLPLAVDFPDGPCPTPGATS